MKRLDTCSHGEILGAQQCRHVETVSLYSNDKLLYLVLIMNEQAENVVLPLNFRNKIYYVWVFHSDARIQ